VTNIFHVKNNVALGQKVHNVANIMVCVENWIKEYWEVPMDMLKSELVKPEYKPYKPPVTPPPTRQPVERMSINSGSYKFPVEYHYSKKIKFFGILTILLLTCLIGFSSYVLYTFGKSVRCFDCKLFNNVTLTENNLINTTSTCDNSTLIWNRSECVPGCKTVYYGDDNIVLYCWIVFGASLLGIIFLCFTNALCSMQNERFIRDGCAIFSLHSIASAVLFIIILIKFIDYQPYIQKQNC